MLKVKDIRAYLNEELSSIYPKNELRAFFYLIAEYVFNYSNTDALMQSESQINSIDIESIKRIVSSLKKEIKLQAILFWDYIKVTLPFYQEEQKTKLIL